MARLKPKEFDPTLLIKNQKWKADTIKELMISEGGKGGSPGTPTPDWDKDWPPKPKPQPKLAMNFQDAMGGGGFVGTTRTNVFVNQGAEAYILEPNGNFKFDGMYDENIHGPLFPRAKAQDGMKIAKKKRNEQRAYEDFVRDSQNMPLDESFKDLRRGQDGEGFDILHELLDLDEAKNNPTDELKIAMSASDVGQQVLQQRAEESKAGKIDRGSRSYVGEDHQRAREIDGEVLWYDEYKHMPFYLDILKRHGHTEELQQIQNEIQQKQSLKINPKIAKTPSQQNATNMRELIKKLTKEGKHIEAQALYREQFPRA